MYEYVLYVDVYMSMTNLKITVTKMYVITVNLLGKAKGMKMVAINMEIPSGCYDCPFAKNERTNDYGSFCECGILEDYETINLLEHSKHPNCPLVEIEPLSDEEKRIFLSAMGKERVICKQIDIDKVDDGSIKKLVPIVNTIERKIKKVLWN